MCSVLHLSITRMSFPEATYLFYKSLFSSHIESSQNHVAIGNVEMIIGLWKVFLYYLGGRGKGVRRTV